jgi:hypothetical protein
MGRTIVDHEQVQELIDAYALGAVTGDEAKAIEEHVAGCITCWEELQAAQRTAGLVALSVPLQDVPERVGERIMAEAAKSVPRKSEGSFLPGFLSSINFGRASTGIFGTAAAGLLAFAVFTQMQVQDLNDDKNELEDDVANTQRIVRVATAPDVQAVSLVSPQRGPGPIPSGEPPTGDYRWSQEEGVGVLFCRNLPDLAEDEVFQAWYTTEAEPVPAGTFESEDGECEYILRPMLSEVRPMGVGVSREKEPGSSKPTGIWLIFARLLGTD